MPPGSAAGISMNEQTSPPPAPAPVVKERVSLTKIVKWSVAAIILVVAIGFGVHYWHLSQRYVSTDNAYVNANRIEIAAQVSGPVTAVYVRDQQAVSAGSVLIEI